MKKNNNIFLSSNSLSDPKQNIRTFRKKYSLLPLVKYIIFILPLFLTYSSFAGNNSNSIIVKNSTNGNVNYTTFTLLQDETINIKGIGYALTETKFNDPTFYGWILNSQTRKEVWNLLKESSNKSSNLKITKNTSLANESNNDSNDGKRDKYQNFEDKIFLTKGNYELYFAGMYRDNEISISFSEAITEFGDLIDEISHIIEISKNKGSSDSFKKSILLNRGNKSSFSDKLNISITSNKKNNVKELEKNDFVDKTIEEAIISFVRTGDDKNIKKGFTLTKETELSIYSIGEVRTDGEFDFSWITNLDNFETVWRMEYDNRNLNHAGGGTKNRFVKEKITLPAGNYMVHYKTDDSHSFEGWNVLPPSDPQFWGITIWAANKKDKKNIKKLNNSKIRKPLLKITKVGNYANEQLGFSVSKKTRIRILALGEGNHRMVDFATIIDADSRETVWKMQRKKTEHAGGASKNRRVLKTLDLDKGNYILTYVSDGSHSYNDWNSTEPYEKENWGVTIWADDESFNKNTITKFDSKGYKSKDIICQILRVKNDRYITKSFNLKEDTKIRIAAIGEGYKPDLADYGWIENDLNGQIVWEMTYRKTDHAGGSKKNRSFNGTIMLSKGEYNLIYKTDDSHSYNNWNATPPDNTDRYGIILTKVK